METSVDTYLLHWNVLRIFSLAWLLVTLVFVTILLPPQLLPVGILGSLLGTSIGALAILKGRWKWSVISLLDVGLMFTVLLLTQTVSKVVDQNLPITLLLFVMLLFAVEVLAVICKHQSVFLNGILRSEALVSKDVLRRSTQNAFRKMSRLGLLFASCYLISLGILFVGAYATSIAPVLADVSLYVVVVSISLALLIILRED